MRLHTLLLTILFSVALTIVKGAKSQSLYDFSVPPESQVQIEVLLVGPSTEAMASVFGHMGLRIKFTDKNLNQNDYVISFLANDGGEEGLKRDLKALSGMYSTVLKIEDFNHFIFRNSIKDDRQIRRFLLPSNSAIDRNLFKILADSSAGKVGYDRFFFFTNNCARNLYTFLGRIGFYINRNIGTTSLKLAPYQHISMLLNPVLLGLIELPSINSIYELSRNIYKKYGIEDFKVAEDRKKAIGEKIKSISIEDLNVLLKFDLTEMPGLRADILREMVARRKMAMKPIDVLLGNVQINENLYLMCTTIECASQQAEILRGMLSSNEIHRLKIRMLSEFSRSKHLIFADELEKSKQYQHALLFEHAL